MKTFLSSLSPKRSILQHGETLQKKMACLQINRNKKRLPSSASSTDTVEQVVKFILNVTEEQALILPGQVPGLKQIGVNLLPSNLTISTVFGEHMQILA